MTHTQPWPSPSWWESLWTLRNWTGTRWVRASGLGLGVSAAAALSRGIISKEFRRKLRKLKQEIFANVRQMSVLRNIQRLPDRGGFVAQHLWCLFAREDGFYVVSQRRDSLPPSPYRPGTWPNEPLPTQTTLCFLRLWSAGRWSCWRPCCPGTCRSSTRSTRTTLM